MVSAILNHGTISAGVPRSPKEKKFIDAKRGDVGNNPHKFKLTYFPTFTWCDFCDLFIWGVVSKQGYQCTGSESSLL